MANDQFHPWENNPQKPVPYMSKCAWTLHYLYICDCEFRHHYKLKKEKTRWEMKLKERQLTFNVRRKGKKQISLMHLKVAQIQIFVCMCM